MKVRRIVLALGILLGTAIAYAGLNRTGAWAQGPTHQVLLPVVANNAP
jgi:hypothetical protein